ncbi:heterokaryon incompatibility protein-domain-containing protein [Leptodontidium sp. 2 PMI_412]|nr:heterokaryon incompatibility protein-domain-containing protein [Leptodontidium sp. 2 PMI_412]
MLCQCCTAVCQEALKQVDKLRQSGLPLGKQNRQIQHFPGHNWTELAYGCDLDCYMCKRFWEKASAKYRENASTGRLYPPGNTYFTVTSFSIMITPDRASSPDPYSNYRISISLYHSEVAYKSHFMAHIHAHDCQQFMVLCPLDLRGLLPRDSSSFRPEKESSAQSVARKIELWKNKCDKRHGKCFKPKNKRGQYPTRLLEIGDKIKLCKSVNVDESEPYVTLSYTWGDPDTVIQTTYDSLHDHEDGIPWSDLPETLQDVIEVTQSLGINYIWIDSLCIIQKDSKLVPVTDFSLESPFMGEIYSNSILTIAASVGSDTHVPCFPERIPEILKPAKFVAPDTASDFFYAIEETVWETAVSGAPLNKRAWVLQERLLSPRTVHLCSEQVFWECSELAACEALPWGLPTKIMERRGGLTQIPQNGFKSFINECSTPTFSRSLQSPQNPQLLDLAYERWCQIVETFSLCGITDPSDKISAITGVAKKMNNVFGDTFHAGLWGSRFLEGLAWEVKSGPETTERGKEPVHALTGQPTYCGPSWSWVSVHGHVHYEFRSSEMAWTPCANVESCIIEPKDNQFTKPQKEGTGLWLKGPLQSIQVDPQNGPLRPRPHIGNWFIWEELFLDTTTIEDHVNDRLFMAPILVGTPGDIRKGKHHIGLVLRGIQGSYQRIGLLHAWKDTTAAKAASLLRTRIVSYYVI